MIFRDYQITLSAQAVELLKTYGLAYLALQMRVGKTLTSLKAASDYGAKKVLFVTRKKAISSIQDDYDLFNPDFIIDIINYEQLHNVFLTGHDFVILDEAHCCSQYPTPAERTRLLKKICIGLPIIYLSGTPSPESYSQLYHQFWISSRSPFGEWTTFYKWAAEFVTLKKKYLYGHSINDYSTANKEKIDQYTKHLFLTYTQKEAGFTQLIDEEILTVRMAESTYRLCERLKRDRLYIGRNGEEIICDTPVKLMNKLHQIFSGTIILDAPEEAMVIDYTKAHYIRDNFSRLKIAVFYKFKAERDMLYATFAQRITEVPDEFNESEDKIFIGQIQASREGINLSTADCLIMLNLDYSAVSYHQARARLQTQLRESIAKVYWLFSEGGIEHKIYQAVMNKRDYTLKYFLRDFNIKRDERIADKEPVYEDPEG